MNTLMPRNYREPINENDKVYILWNFVIQTDRGIKTRRPYILAADKTSVKSPIIAIAVPGIHEDN